MFLNDDFFDATLDHWTSQNDERGSNGEPPNSTLAAWSNVFDIDNMSTAEVEAWWLASEPDGSLGGYTGSTSIDPCDGLAGRAFEFEQPHTGEPDCSLPSTVPTPMATLADVYYLNALGQQHGGAPEQAGSSTLGPSTVPDPARPRPSPPSGTPPSAVPAPSWGDSPLSPETCAVAEDHRYDTRDQPLVAQNLRTRWRACVVEGKDGATDPISPVEPPPAGKIIVWQSQQPWIAGIHGPSLDPQVGDGANLPAQTPSSTGPQRSVGSAKGKGKERGKSEGRRKRTPMECLPPGIDWPTTYNRFYAEMVKICIDKPTGEVPDPETAYAEINKFTKDDIHLSPLIVKQLGERPCRDLEQYLTGILNELRPWQKGQKKGIQFTLEAVEQELAEGLVASNDNVALMENPLSDVDPRKPETSEEAAKWRSAEQERREAIRRCLGRMTLFFKRTHPRHFWTKPQVLFYVITYLLFGAGVFGDGGAFFTPKPQL